MISGGALLHDESFRSRFENASAVHAIHAGHQFRAADIRPYSGVVPQPALLKT